MKRRLKRLFFNSIKMALSLLMVFTTINLAGIQNVSAAELLPEATMSYSGTTGIQVDLSSAGVNKTGYIYNMKLDNGQAFCLDAGYHARKGQYARSKTVTGSMRNRIWNYCLNDVTLNHYFNGTPGSWSNGTRAVAQGMFWAYEEGVGEDNAAEIICKVWAEVDPGTLTTAGEYAKGVAKAWWNAMKSYSSSGTLYIYSYGKSDNQKLITSKNGTVPVLDDDRVGAEKTYSITENVNLKINKSDGETSNKLEGVAFDLYRDGTKVTTVYTNNEGVASYTFSNTFSKTATATKTYVSNYDDLSLENQEYVRTVYDYLNVTDAKAAADAEALAKAKAEVEALTGQNHHYAAIEVGTRNYYYLEPNVTLSKDVAGNGEINFDLTNEVQRGSITLNKVDKNLNNNSDDSNIFDANNDGAEGDATISGATYGLYAAETINHPDGKSGIVTYNSTGGINQIILTKGTNLDVKNVAANAGTLLATAKTDSNGEIQFDHLYAGKYYIKEIESSEGYLLDETQYDIDLTASNDVKVITKNATSQEQVKKQAFDLYKAGHVPGTSTNAKPLKDVEFTVKLESDVQRMGWENAPTYDVLTTYENGQASSIELPYGTYRVRETKPAVDYNTAEDFFVNITEDSRTHQSFTNNVIIDETFQAMIKAVKLDKETGKQVQLPNAEFKIKALTDCYVDGKKFNAGEYIGYWNWNIFDGFYTDSWKTNDQGYVLINEKLSAGEYQLEEIHAPYGYVLDDEPIQFTVTNQNMYELAEDGKTPIITVVKSDVSVKGQITVYKKGEVLTDFEDGQFIYETKSLPNAKYNILAKVDILDPSNDGTVLYRKGTIVETLITGANGTATSSKLPLGEYEVQEVEAPDGMVLNTEKKSATLEYADENTPLVFDNASFTNERQKVELDLKKLDIDENVPLAGAEFKMYANKDIIDYQGNVIVQKGQFIAVATSDDEGVLDFNIDLPVDLNSTTTSVDPDEIDGGFTVITDENGNRIIGDTASMFKIRETKSPIGYATLNTIMYLDTTYLGQNFKKITIAYDLYNEMTRVVFSKTDITNDEPVIGAQLSVIPVKEDGTLDLGSTFDTWITMPDNPNTRENESVHLIKGLEPGKYILRENLGMAAELGYVTANDVEFTVKDTGEIQSVNMKDDHTKVDFDKVDIATNESVIGTQLSVIPVNEDGTLNVGATFETWITDGTTHRIEYLPIGDYVLRETLQGQAWDYGYVTAEDVKFTVRDTADIQTVEMIDDFTKVEITKTDIVTGNPVPGAQLSIIPVKEDGTLDLGATFDTWITQADDFDTEDIDESIHYIERIPVGKYVLREKLGQAAELGYVTANDVEFEVKDTAVIQQVEMKDDFTHTEFTKVDVDGNAVAGATMAIIPLDDDGNMLKGETFDTWVTQIDDPNTEEVDESIHKVEYLPVGHYALVELSASNDYVKALPVVFEVKDTAEIQKYSMVDKQVGLNKIDHTGRTVVGSHIQLLDAKTKEVVEEFTTDGHTIYSSIVEIGKTYIWHEVSAPENYILAEDIEFTVTEDNENQIYTMIDTRLDKVAISKKDVTTKEELPGAKLKITDMQGNVIEEWISEKDPHYVWLVVGKKYKLIEEIAPKNYKVAEAIIFEIDDNGNIVQQVVMYDELLPVKKITKTGDDTTVGSFAGLGMIALSGIAILSSKKRKRLKK